MYLFPHKKKKKIAIVVSDLTHGGVRRYVFNVLQELDAMHREDVAYTVFCDEDYFDGLFTNIRVKRVRAPGKVFWYYFSVFFSLLFARVDVILYPKGTIPFTHVCVRAQKVNVIHDLGYFERSINAYPFWETLYMQLFMRLSCVLARTTVADSVATKDDLVRRFGICPEKIVVVHAAVEDTFTVLGDKEEVQRVVSSYVITQPFFFYAGSISPRKNLLRVLQAFNQIKQDIPHEFVIASMMSWESSEVLHYIERNLKDRVRLVGFVNEKELIALYNAADAFVYASLYEGFGLPILESQACGCVLITSNVTSCPEVAGKGAMIVNPYVTDQIAEAMKRSVCDEALRRRLREDGFTNLHRFSWLKTAHKLLEVVLCVPNSISEDQ